MNHLKENWGWYALMICIIITIIWFGHGIYVEDLENKIRFVANCISVDEHLDEAKCNVLWKLARGQF